MYYWEDFSFEPKRNSLMFKKSMTDALIVLLIVVQVESE